MALTDRCQKITTAVAALEASEAKAARMDQKTDELRGACKLSLDAFMRMESASQLPAAFKHLIAALAAALREEVPRET